MIQSINSTCSLKGIVDYMYWDNDKGRKHLYNFSLLLLYNHH